MDQPDSLTSLAQAWLRGREQVAQAHAQAALVQEEFDRRERLGLPQDESGIGHWSFDPASTDPCSLSPEMQAEVARLLSLLPEGSPERDLLPYVQA